MGGAGELSEREVGNHSTGRVAQILVLDVCVQPSRLGLEWRRKENCEFSMTNDERGIGEWRIANTTRRVSVPPAELANTRRKVYRMWQLDLSPGLPAARSSGYLGGLETRSVPRMRLAPVAR